MKFNSIEDACAHVHRVGLNPTDDDAKSFMEYLNALPVPEQMLVWKGAHLHKHTPFVGMLLRNHAKDFKDSMAILAAALTTPEEKRTEEQKVIYALVKHAD